MSAIAQPRLQVFRAQPNLRFPAKLGPLLKPKRFKIIYGGRGSAKSHSVAQLLLMMGTRRKLRILCAREVQKTLKDSSMQVLKDYIERLGLQRHYRVLENEIRGWNGTTFQFTGLQEHTSESLKSYEGVDIVWVEEAHTVSEMSWLILIPTIRKEDGGPFGTGSEIWATFNPDQESDYVYKRFVKGKDEDAVVIPLNWRDNPWFGKIMNAERLKMKAINDDLYNHIWEGKCRSASGVLFKRRWFKFYDTLPERLSRAYMATDYAGAPDPAQPEADPDWIEAGCAKLDRNGNLYFLDWWGDQCDADVWIPALSNMAKTNDVLIWYEEKGVVLRSQDGAIAKALREERCNVYRHPLASASSKAERALGFAVMASRGQIYFPKDQPWVERVINQLCSFTGQDGKKDDAVDVCSLMARGLDVMTEPPKDEAEAEEKVTPFTKRWLEHDGSEISDEDVSDHYR